MIYGLKGQIESLEATFLEINVNGVIYGVGISLNTYNAIKEKQADKEIKLYCTQIIREDANLLFGFDDMLEKRSFERLIKINGVGPKVAMAILSTYTPSSFGAIIENKDISALQRVPGIGAKGAGKIMVDLAGFFTELLDGGSGDIKDKSKQEAYMALISLGFKKPEIDKTLKLANGSDTAELIKSALKMLQKL